MAVLPFPFFTIQNYDHVRRSASYCRWQQALDLLMGIKRRGLAPDVVSYSSAMSACDRAGEWQVNIGRYYRGCWNYAMLSRTVSSSYSVEDSECFCSWLCRCLDMKNLSETHPVPPPSLLLQLVRNHCCCPQGCCYIIWSSTRLPLGEVAGGPKCGVSCPDAG